MADLSDVRDFDDPADCRERHYAQDVEGQPRTGNCSEYVDPPRTWLDDPGPVKGRAHGKRCAEAEAERDRLAEENRQLREAGEALAGWIEPPNFEVRTWDELTQLRAALDRWREVAGDDAR